MAQQRQRQRYRNGGGPDGRNTRRAIQRSGREFRTGSQLTGDGTRLTWDEAVSELTRYGYGTVAARGLLSMADRNGTYTDDGTVITSSTSGLARVYQIGSVT